jgi:sorbitol-specific phosphotransferase system component IIC
MPETPKSPLTNPANLYLFAGIAFLASGVVFLLTNMNGLWVAFFALGLVFIVLSTTERAKAAKAATESAPEKDETKPDGDV